MSDLTIKNWHTSSHTDWHCCVLILARAPLVLLQYWWACVDISQPLAKKILVKLTLPSKVCAIYTVISVRWFRTVISPSCRIFTSVNRVSIGSDNDLSPIRRQPLSKPMLGNCQLDPKIQTSVNFNQNTKPFINENASENIVCEMRPFCAGKWVNVWKDFMTWVGVEIIFSRRVCF